MLSAKTPFKGLTELNTFENVLQKNIPFPATFDKDAKDLII